MKSTVCFRIKSISAIEDCFNLNNMEKKGATLKLFFPVFPSLEETVFGFYCYVRHIGISGWLLRIIYVFTARFLQMYITSTSDSWYLLKRVTWIFNVFLVYLSNY